MTDSGTRLSDKLVRESMSFVGQSPVHPHTPQGTLGRTSVMLSVDYAALHGENARNEKIKQITQNHFAFERIRHTQDILVKTQHALRRMPGVSGQDANELVSQLQEVGQSINHETIQLVDALANMTLDQEETDKAIARMSIDANLAQARTDVQAQTISDLRAQVKAERDMRDMVEAQAKQTLERFETLVDQLNRVKDKAKEREEATSPDGLVKVGESACRQGSPPQTDRKAQSLAENLRQMDTHMLSTALTWPQEQRQAQTADGDPENKQAVQPKALTEAVTTPVEGGGGGGDDSLVTRSSLENAPPSGPVRVSPAFQSMARTPTTAPPKFGPLQAGPPRAPAAMSHERRFQGQWAGQGRSSSMGANGGFTSSSAFSNPPRKAGFQPLPRYRPNGGGADHHPYSGFGTPQDCGGARSASSFDHRREYYPSTPTSAGRRQQFGRFSGSPVATFGGAASSAMVGRGGGFAGAPPIHLTERAVAAWNQQMMDFYGAIRHFVARHASEPDHDMALVGRSSLWPVMLAMHHPLSESEAASYLGFHLRNENSKACVVTRVIVDYVVNRVWVPAAWTGADSKTTYDLMDLKRGLETSQGQPSAARQPLLNQQASIVGYIMKSEQGTAWHQHKVDDISRALQATVQPLLNRRSVAGDVHGDVEHVAELAWELSSKMLRSRLTFDFRFPDIGARFSSQSMLPIWPHMDPADMQAQHWRVAFVTTPAITCRNDTGGSISAHSVSLADVLCMQ